MSAHEPAYPSRGGLMFYVPEHARGEIEKAVVAIDKKHEGLTKRELIAAMAMHGIIACGNGWPSDRDAPEVARRALVHADALIAALAHQPVPAQGEA